MDAKTADAATTDTLDPVTKTVIWNKFLSISREMSTIIERSSQNFVTAELHDFCVGLFDTQGRSIAHYVGLPGQIGAGSLQVKALLKRFPGQIEPGDVFIMNDPYKGFGTHLPDITLFYPVFHEGVLVCLAMARGHQEDMGGSLPGGYFPGAYDIHAEGLVIPPTRIYARGEETPVYEFFLNNIRFPDGMRIDNAAMIAAMKVAERRLVDRDIRQRRAAQRGPRHLRDERRAQPDDRQRGARGIERRRRHARRGALRHEGRAPRGLHVRGPARARHAAAEQRRDGAHARVERGRDAQLVGPARHHDAHDRLLGGRVAVGRELPAEGGAVAFVP